MRRILTVTSASPTEDLTTLETIKAELGITDTSKDVLLARYIGVGSGAVARYLDRVLGKATVVETFRYVRGIEALPLARAPVTSIASVTVGGATLATTEYEVNSESGLLHRVGVCPADWCSDAIVVTYTGGYELLDELPYEIEEACIRLVKGQYFARTRDPMVKSETIPDAGEFQYWVGPMPGADAAALPGDVLALLMPFRHIAV